MNEQERLDLIDYLIEKTEDLERRLGRILRGDLDADDFEHHAVL